jgi:hypothetical protein
MCVSCFPFRLFDRHAGPFERRNSGRRIDLDRHQVLDQGLIEMLREETGLRGDGLIRLHRHLHRTAVRREAHLRPLTHCEPFHILGIHPEPTGIGGDLDEAGGFGGHLAGMIQDLSHQQREGPLVLGA